MRLLVASIVLWSVSGAAHADRADQLFKKGKRLLAQKKYPEACKAFQDSDRTDPGIGAKLNVARCYQEWGKLATAWRWYVDAENMANNARDERAPKIHALVEALEPSVPRLTVKAPRDASLTGVLVQLDGVALDVSALGVVQRVDPGPHEIGTTISGVIHTRTVPVERGGNAEVVLEIPNASAPRSGTRDGTGPEPAVDVRGDPGRTRRQIGLGVSGAGGLAIVIAGLVTLGARSDYKHALEASCQGATDLCDEQGLSATHSAMHRANVATVVTLGGVAAVAGGLIVYFTAPRAPRAAEHALYLAPTLGADGASIVFGGAF